MPFLKLLTLECQNTEDDTGDDEAYIRINGRRVWGSEINDNETRNLSDVERTEFVDNCRIDLYDKDDRRWFDPDDHLGTQYVWARQAGRGASKVCRSTVLGGVISSIVGLRVPKKPLPSSWSRFVGMTAGFLSATSRCNLIFFH